MFKDYGTSGDLYVASFLLITIAQHKTPLRSYSTNTYHTIHDEAVDDGTVGDKDDEDIRSW